MLRPSGDQVGKSSSQGFRVSWRKEPSEGAETRISAVDGSPWTRPTYTSSFAPRDHAGWYCWISGTGSSRRACRPEPSATTMLTRPPLVVAYAMRPGGPAGVGRTAATPPPFPKASTRPAATAAATRARPIKIGHHSSLDIAENATDG